MESLTEFIRSNPDPRELKRALAVKMVKQNYSYYQIRDTLGVSVGFISDYQQKFKREGIEGLKLKYQGCSWLLNSYPKTRSYRLAQRKRLLAIVRTENSH